MLKYIDGSDGITTVKDGDTVVARYIVDHHWREVNSYVKDGKVFIRLFNKMRKYLDAVVETGTEEIQKIPAD